MTPASSAGSAGSAAAAAAPQGYERECWAFWNERLGDGERAAWRVALGALGYDAGNEELAVNEFQARDCRMMGM